MATKFSYQAGAPSMFVTEEFGDSFSTRVSPIGKFWSEVLPKLGFQGTVLDKVMRGFGDVQAATNDFTPEARAFIEDLQAQGFDVGSTSAGPGYTIALTGPDGNVVTDESGKPVSFTGKEDTILSSLSGAVKGLAPVLLPALTAGLGGPLASTLGVSQPVAAGLISGGVTALGGGDIGDIARAGVTAGLGSYASNALLGGGSLLTPEMQATISSNPQGAFLGEGVASGVPSLDASALAAGVPLNSLLTPDMQAAISSSPQGAFLGESAIPSAVTSSTFTPSMTPAVGSLADSMTGIDMSGNVISGSTGEVLIPAQAAGTAGAGVNALADSMTGVDMSGNVVNALTGEVIVPAAAAGGIDLSSIPAGIQEGMAPGGYAGSVVTPEELAAVGSVTGAGAAGAGALEGTDAAMADLAGSTQITPDAMTTAGTTLGVPDALWGPIIGTIASLYGGSQMADAARDAARTQDEAIDRATQLQRDIYEKGIALQEPFYLGGKEAFNRLTALSTGGPEAAQNFLAMDPGYGFRLGEGMKALERLQASRGGLLSGGAIKAGQRYAQDVASQEYGNAYNRLAQLADVGPRAAGVTSQLGQNYATSAGNLMSQSGVNSANALLAGAAGRQSAYGDIGNIWGRYFGGGR